MKKTKKKEKKRKWRTPEWKTESPKSFIGRRRPTGFGQSTFRKSKRNLNNGGPFGRGFFLQRIRLEKKLKWKMTAIQIQSNGNATKLSTTEVAFREI